MAVEMATQALRDIAIVRAHEGDNRLLMSLLRTLRPEVYGRTARERIFGQARR